MALTYTTLQTQIADFINRDDLASQIPTFILMAEAAFNRDIRHWQMEKRSEATFNERYEPLPSDWLSTVRVSVSGERQLDQISQAQMVSRRESTGNAAGKPLYYSISSSQIELFPTPDGDYDGSMIYHARIPELTAIATSNWMLTDNPDIYIYGSLIHTAPYLQEDARVAVWAGLYKDAVNRLNSNSKTDPFSGTGMAMR